MSNTHNIEFLESLVCKDHNNNLQTTLYEKPTDRQNDLNTKSTDYHPLKIVFLAVKH